MNRRELLISAGLASLALQALSRWSVAEAQDGSRIFTLANPTAFPTLTRPPRSRMTGWCWPISTKP